MKNKVKIKYKMAYTSYFSTIFPFSSFQVLLIILVSRIEVDVIIFVFPSDEMNESVDALLATREVMSKRSVFSTIRMLSSHNCRWQEDSTLTKTKKQWCPLLDPVCYEDRLFIESRISNI